MVIVGIIGYMPTYVNMLWAHCYGKYGLWGQYAEKVEASKTIWRVEDFTVRVKGSSVPC